MAGELLAGVGEDEVLERLGHAGGEGVGELGVVADLALDLGGLGPAEAAADKRRLIVVHALVGVGQVDAEEQQVVVELVAQGLLARGAAAGDVRGRDGLARTVGSRDEGRKVEFVHNRRLSGHANVPGKSNTRPGRDPGHRN